METSRPSLVEETMYELGPEMDQAAVANFLGRGWTGTEEYHHFMFRYTNQETGKDIQLHFPKNGGAFRVVDWQNTRIELQNPERIVLRKLPGRRTIKNLVVENRTGNIAVNTRTLEVVARGDLIVSAKFGSGSDLEK